jgi:protein-S-isoprenylcysteine O-methyltransferase Ste14
MNTWLISMQFSLCAYFLWMLVEFRVSKKEVETEGRKPSDSATCQLYGFGQALAFLAAPLFPSAWRVPSTAHFAGMSIFLFGVCYRLWAIRTLGHDIAPLTVLR